MKVCGPQCEGCVHYRNISSGFVTSRKCCHYLLDTGERRKHNETECFSRREKWKKAEKPFEIPMKQR